VKALALVGLAPFVVACAAATAVRDLEGRPFDPLDGSGARATVLVFTDVECPIANAYAPELRRIAEEFGPAGVRFFLVYADPDRTAPEVRAHREAFGYPMPALLDPEHELVARTGATTTPEACLFLSSGELAYRGRIDDRYVDFGKQRAAPTTRELRAALEAVLAGRAPPTARAPVLGCAIPCR
jgi:hypothetical protein